MQEFLFNLLIAVITAAVPVITAYAVSWIKKAAENVAADTEDIKTQNYIIEIAAAVSDAVMATNQTYVDALKNTGAFTKDAQAEAAKKALEACIKSLSPAARQFVTEVYGDLTEYLTTKIEAEVKAQKNSAPVQITPAMESDAKVVAASTAAATAASIAQTAISQLNAEATATE